MADHVEAPGRGAASRIAHAPPIVLGNGSDLSSIDALASVASDPVWRCAHQPSMQFRFLNPAGERALDVSLPELADDPQLAVRRTHPADRSWWGDGHAHDGMPTGPQQLRWARRDGVYVRLEVRRVLVRDSEHRIVATIGIARPAGEPGDDVALRAALVREQQAVDQLRAIDDLRQTFLRAVSHELRTPLAGVLGYAETLQEHRAHLPDDRVEQLIDRLVRNATRLRDLLDDLLDIDRLARGTLVADRREVDVATCVLRVVEQIGAPMGKIRVDVQHAVAAIDEPKYERIVDNLVHNAVRHAGAAASVWVHLLEDGADVLLVVEDDGPGIDPEHRARLFEPFEQGSLAATAASPGTGLGLSLVRQFVELHDGDITVGAGREGGARFEVRVPRHPRR